MYKLFTDPTPTNTETLSRLAKRWEGAKEITRAGYWFIAREECGTVDVCKPVGGWAYTIITEDFFAVGTGCNCLDFQKHGDFCKHTLAYQGRDEILTEFEAEACQMDKESYRRWRDRETAAEEGYITC